MVDRFGIGHFSAEGPEEVDWTAWLGSGKTVLLPWNLPSYVPLNGFHQLLRGIPRRLRSDHSSFVQIDLESPRISSEMSGVLRQAFFEDQAPVWARAVPSGSQDAAGSLAVEVALRRSARADIEFHHTRIPVPVHPFVLHCESFEPLFFPILQTGHEWGSREWTAAQEWLAVLASARCLAVVTHVKETFHTLRTLISEYFGPSLAGRVHLVPPSLIWRGAPSAVTSLDSLGGNVRERTRDRKTLLFSASQQHNPQSFLLRGGVALVNALPELFRAFPHLEVILLGPYLTGEQLRGLGCSEPGIAAAGRITWIPGFLEDAIVDRIFEEVDIYVLPSASLHSASLMRAMNHGCTIVATRVPGIESVVGNYGGISMLDSLQAAVWESPLGSRQVTFSRYKLMLGSITSELREVLEGVLSANARSHDVHIPDGQLSFPMRTPTMRPGQGVTDVSVLTIDFGLQNVEDRDFEEALSPQVCVDGQGVTLRRFRSYIEGHSRSGHFMTDDVRNIPSLAHDLRIHGRMNRIRLGQVLLQGARIGGVNLPEGYRQALGEWPTGTIFRLGSKKAIRVVKKKFKSGRTSAHA